MLEMRSRIPCCEHELREHISPRLIEVLEFIDSESGQDLQFSSGLRCQTCNARVGGVKRSEHITGEGADILVSNSQERFMVTMLAMQAGSVRIGIGRRFIHIGVNKDLPQEVIWLY